MKKDGLFMGKNRVVLLVVFFAAVGIVALPSAQGVAGVLVFPALFAGIFFGMSIMLGLIVFIERQKGKNIENATSKGGHGE